MKWHGAPILFLLVGLTAGAQSVGSLADVKVIYAGGIVGSDRAERFRSLVAKELSSRGFIVTESENADVTLSGALTVSTQQETSGIATGGVVAVTPGQPRLYYECRVVLKNRDGAVLWQWEGDAGSKRSWESIELEPVASLALKLARALEKDYKKALKKKTKP